MTRMTPQRLDLVCLTVLLAVWMVFFWRLLTPVEADRASLTQGDFSAQFVTFGAYQAARFGQGEVPLWNPYNNGGLPFIADTQAAVFYPPRLLTIALANLGGGWSYHALEWEMMLHVLAYSIMFYALLRVLTGGQRGTHAASLTGALVAGYGGYMTGYPPLQLALLEAGVWLPLVVIGLTLAAGRSRGWLAVGGWALGMSWLAGHPQTSYFLTLLAVAYWGYQTHRHGLGWRWWLGGTTVLGLLSVGVVAVTLFPGIEYLILTSRAGYTFDAKSNGFPYIELMQIAFPHVFSLFSPLYVGVVGALLAVVGVWARGHGALFWGAVALVSLLFSVGDDGALYHALYNVLPGLRYFRGQERVAFLFANSAAILVAFGALWLMQAERGALQRVLRWAWVWAGGLVLAAFIAAGAWLVNAAAVSPLANAAAFSAGFAVVVAIAVQLMGGRARLGWVLVGVVLVELVSANIDRPSNFDPIPADQQLVMNPLIAPVLADPAHPFRVDGLRVLGGNYGSYYGIMDIQGISPLFLTGPQAIIEDGLPDERAWELFAVRYVWSDWDALTVPWEKLATGTDELGEVNLFRLAAPRPFAHLAYEAVQVGSDREARERLADPNFDPRRTAILHAPLEVALPAQAPEVYGTTVTTYAPERVVIVSDTPTPAVLTVAQVDYPGWHASIDGAPTDIVRAYGGLVAVIVPAGTHTVELRYDPLTYRVGAVVSFVTWAGLAVFGLVALARMRSKR
jgi:hypothetical protein